VESGISESWVCKERWGIGNFGILGLQGGLGAGSGIGNFGILGLQGALGAGVEGCVTLQGGKCNFNLRTLGILNILALGALGPGLEIGI
jgi:hypothetical protein